MANEQMVKRIEAKAEKRFVISDLHFFHEEIIQYENRPFKSVKEMNHFMIKQWNSVVGKNDIVYICGDFAVKYKKKAKLLQIVHMLNGMKVLYPMGNHDSRKSAYYIDVGFLNAVRKPILIEPNVVLMHEPPMPKDVVEGLFYIHGHTHTNWCEVEEYENCFNVSAERLNYKPINLDLLIEALKNGKKKEFAKENNITGAVKNWGRTHEDYIKNK